MSPPEIISSMSDYEQKLLIDARNEIKKLKKESKRFRSKVFKSLYSLFILAFFAFIAYQLHFDSIPQKRLRFEECFKIVSRYSSNEAGEKP